MRTRKERGAVSVFLVVILVPCMLVASIFVDVGRVYLSKGMAESSAELALNTLMTNYDYDLNDWYGMVASCQDIDSFYDISSEYFIRALQSQNLNDDEIVLLADQFRALIGKDSVSDYLKVAQTEGPTVSAVQDANLANATMIKSQIVDFMKYRAPIVAVEEIVNKFQNNPQVTDFLECEENEELKNKKSDFFTSEGVLHKDSYESYKYLWDNYTAKNPTNAMLQSDLDALKGYRSLYEEINRTMITNLYNTSGLELFSRPIKDITDGTYNDASTGWYTEKKGSSYYIKKEDMNKIFEKVEDSIKNFHTARNSLVNQVNNTVIYGNDTNQIQYWRYSIDLINSNTEDGRSYMTVYLESADEMREAYHCMNYMMDRCKFENLPEGYEALPEDYKETYTLLKQQVEELHSKYLTSDAGGISDPDDAYLVLVQRLESISASNLNAINPAAVTLSTGNTIDAELSRISGELQAKKSELQSYIDILDTAINGDGDKLVSLDTLVSEAEDYRRQLNEWTETAGQTHTNMADQDEEEISKLEEDQLADVVSAESVQNMKERLQHMQSQFQGVIAAIDSMQYGGTKIADITSYTTLKAAADQVDFVNELYPKTTNAELNAYAANVFQQKFSPYSASGDAVASLNPSDDYNVECNPQTKAVAVPEIYQYWHIAFQGAKEDVEAQYESDKSAAEDEENKVAENAKNKEVTYKSAQEINGDIYVGSKKFEVSTLLTSLTSIVENLATDNMEEIRDNLYLSVYMLHMFSYSTYENEGKYALLEERGYDMGLLDQGTYENAYQDCVGNADTESTWKSESKKDSYNKSLTNKMINPANNAAYSCEVEYILYGGSNQENISKAYGQIYGLRYTLNLISAFQQFWSPNSSNTSKAVNAIAAAISSATAGIIPPGVVKLVLLPLLTVFETAYDMGRLEAGFPVELYKSKASDWQVSLDRRINQPESLGNSVDSYKSGYSSVSALLNAVKSVVGFYNPEDAGGLQYSDYLTLFVILGMQDKELSEAMTLRMAEVIQTNMGMLTGDSDYKMRKAVTYFDFKASLRVDPLLMTLPFYSDYNGAYDKVGTDWCTYQVEIIRGY